MYVCVCVRACVRACVCGGGGGEDGRVLSEFVRHDMFL